MLDRDRPRSIDIDTSANVICEDERMFRTCPTIITHSGQWGLLAVAGYF